MALHIRDAEALAAKAWNVTKDDADPTFFACTPDHRAKLIAAVNSIIATGSADIAGLERFEQYVKGVAPQGTEVFSAVVPTPSAEFLAAAVERQKAFSAKEAELLEKELQRVEAEQKKADAAVAAEEAKADKQLAAAIKADAPPAQPNAPASPAAFAPTTANSPQPSETRPFHNPATEPEKVR